MAAAGSLPSSFTSRLQNDNKTRIETRTHEGKKNGNAGKERRIGDRGSGSRSRSRDFRTRQRATNPNPPKKPQTQCCPDDYKMKIKRKHEIMKIIEVLQKNESVTATLLNFIRMFLKAHDENIKQAELEKKKAEKEAEMEKKAKKEAEMEKGKSSGLTRKSKKDKEEES
ncbi:unnamed protein product [Vicia faba]|uniref:Uncharacterized protein n=1 Tax=Vicia faba TaxID=3906 RepID=A0AAV0YPM2_VICFA|nr:unnamed protein product [Vicia faba]CAI8587423.1 unnamed protein product [Vicia faba]